jgi:hypothetical protein
MPILDYGEKQMHNNFQCGLVSLAPIMGNPKAKTCGEQRRTIENLKM